MKHFVIETIVNAPMEKVWQNFDIHLFHALQPAFPKTEILQFDGSEPGNEVKIILHILGLKQRFFARIVDRKESAAENYFIDEGTETPFFIKTWRHKHIVSRLDENSSVIKDNITFSSPNKIMEAFFYPVLYAQMYFRKAVYRKYFSQKI
ncbi:MAG: hypothetical protein EOP53_14870 [Sphingobacteriales bacterium]|nr:MAG: hypothetical protein EOP53_14870 [Sphingobacteriales bacterium]